MMVCDYEALRRGWYLGEETFRDRLLLIEDKAKGIKMRGSRKADDLERDYSEKDAEQIIQRCGSELGLPTGEKDLGQLKKGDARKALMAALIRWRSAASTEWIAKRLQMGHPGSVSRQVGIVNKDKKPRKNSMILRKCSTAGTPEMRDGLLEAARAAVAACPTGALTLRE